MATDSLTNPWPINDYVWPYYPNYPVYPVYPVYPSSYITSPDSERIAALEARITKLERDNQRLRRGLGRLYILQKEAR